MPKNKRKRAATAHRPSRNPLRPARGSRRGRRSRINVWALAILSLAASCALFSVGWKVHGRVRNLRVGRAFDLARQVLKQTQRSAEEQERCALAIARRAVEKGLNPAVVSAIVVVESGGNPLTVSPSGDLGLILSCSHKDTNINFPPPVLKARRRICDPLGPFQRELPSS